MVFTESPLTGLKASLMLSVCKLAVRAYAQSPIDCQSQLGRDAQAKLNSCLPTGVSYA